jgi:CBS-domain-containing membrane protein
MTSNPFVTLKTKLRGQQTSRPPRASTTHIILSALGAFISIGVIAGFSKSPNGMLIMGSFGGTCVLLFGFPDSPFAQPRNVILGHTFSYATGLIVAKLLGAHWWSLGIALGLSIAIMMTAGVVHPPAGANPVIIYLSIHYMHTDPGWHSILFPALLGSAALVAVALLFNNLTRDEAYPRYW